MRKKFVFFPLDNTLVVYAGQVVRVYKNPTPASLQRIEDLSIYSDKCTHYSYLTPEPQMIYSFGY